MFLCFGYFVFRVSASLCWVASALRSPVRFEVLRILCPVLSYSLLSSFSFFVRLTCHNFKRVFHPLKYFTVPVHMSQCHVVKMSTFLSICHPVICDWSFSVLWSDLSIETRRIAVSSANRRLCIWLFKLYHVFCSMLYILSFSRCPCLYCLMSLCLSSVLYRPSLSLRTRLQCLSV